jgi:hypothetical protein
MTTNLLLPLDYYFNNDVVLELKFEFKNVFLISKLLNMFNNITTSRITDVN